MTKKNDKLKKKHEEEILNKYPRLVIFEGFHVDQKIISTIKKSYKTTFLSLDVKRKTNDVIFMCEFFKHVKKYKFNSLNNASKAVNTYFEKFSGIADKNFSYVFDALKKSKTDKSGFFIAAAHIATSMLTSHINNECGLNSLMPDIFILSGLYEDSVFVKFYKLYSQPTSAGRIYRHTKNLMVDGKEYELWFTKHALERVMQRVTSPELSNRIVAEFMHHAHFEFNGFGKFQHLLCAYMSSSTTGTLITNILNEIPTIKGHKPIDIISKYLYFPFIVEENKIICKSALIPGFYGTPEYSTRQSLENNNIIYNGNKVNLEEPIENDGFQIIPQKIVKNFFNRECWDQTLYTKEYHVISYLFHKLGEHQFFMGELNSFLPIITKRI